MGKTCQKRNLQLAGAQQPSHSLPQATGGGARFASRLPISQSVQKKRGARGAREAWGLPISGTVQGKKKCCSRLSGQAKHPRYFFPWNPESEEVGLVASVACWACYAISVRSTTSELGEAMTAKLQLHPARAAQEGVQSCSLVLQVDVDSALAAMGTPPIAQSLIVQYCRAQEEVGSSLPGIPAGAPGSRAWCCGIPGPARCAIRHIRRI